MYIRHYNRHCLSVVARLSKNWLVSRLMTIYNEGPAQRSCAALDPVGQHGLFRNSTGAEAGHPIVWWCICSDKPRLLSASARIRKRQHASWHHLCVVAHRSLHIWPLGEGPVSRPRVKFYRCSGFALAIIHAADIPDVFHSRHAHRYGNAPN